ncbi:hypothetical protein U9M48_025728 [Paspalum notatum var. saurae]|uniref:Uncharacterized protein n=1 Tax=Paspalum notatum var. saurae TaxID=547442 RepID=A0AAQ3TR22_PASNO
MPGASHRPCRTHHLRPDLGMRDPAGGRSPAAAILGFRLASGGALRRRRGGGEGRERWRRARFGAPPESPRRGRSGGLYLCVEASAVVSNSNGGPDLQRALSLLSINSAGAGNHHPATQLHPGLSTLASACSPAVMQASSPAGLWQDGMALDPLGNGSAVELQLPKPSSHDNSSPSHYDLMH